MGWWLPLPVHAFVTSTSTHLCPTCRKLLSTTRGRAHGWSSRTRCTTSPVSQCRVNWVGGGWKMSITLRRSLGHYMFHSGARQNWMIVIIGFFLVPLLPMLLRPQTGWINIREDPRSYCSWRAGTSQTPSHRTIPSRTSLARWGERWTHRITRVAPALDSQGQERGRRGITVLEDDTF